MYIVSYDYQILGVLVHHFEVTKNLCQPKGSRNFKIERV